MTCAFKDPACIQKAMHERATRAKMARSEDEYLAAAESTWEEYIECYCDECNSDCED